MSQITDTPDLELRLVAPDQVIPVAKQLGHKSMEVMEDWQTRAEAGKFVMFAVFDGENAAASINILLDGADEQVVKDEIGLVPMLNALGVNEPYRRRGLAGQLMERCEAYVQEYPDLPQALVLGVEPDNAGARTLYEKLGYQYHKIAGEDLFVTTWPELDEHGKRYMFETKCLLMVKGLS